MTKGVWGCKLETMRIFLAALATVLLFPPGANADPKWLADSQRIAVDYWGTRGYHQCDNLSVDVVWHTGYVGGVHVGSALVGGCQLERDCDSGVRNCYPHGIDTDAFINLSDQIIGRKRRLNCRLIVHEYGHLVGLEHDSRFGVMNGSGLIPRVCKPNQFVSTRMKRNNHANRTQINTRPK